MTPAERRHAADGLPARANGAYAKGKHEWLEEYLRAGLSVASRKLHRVYVDLFAGPGVNVDPNSGEEFLSGALRALQLVGNNTDGSPFTDAYLVNIDSDDHDALKERIRRLNESSQLRIPFQKIHVICADANLAIHEILSEVHPLAWMFVFADIEAPKHLPFTTVAELKRRGNGSVDLYTLFPLQMALQRMMPYEGRENDKSNETITNYFGTDEWRSVHGKRVTDALAPEFRRDLEALYCRRLGTLWREADCVARIQLNGQRSLYHMIFAASDPTALRVANGVTRKMEQLRNAEQPNLF